MYAMENTQFPIIGNKAKEWIRLLKKREIGFFDVPEEYRLEPNLVKIERELGIRKSNRRGYDVIRNTFFVEEIIFTKNITEKRYNYFSDFASYYDFLNGDIYENACYYHYKFSSDEIENYNIDIDRINDTALIRTTFKDFSLELSEEEMELYKEAETKKKLRKKWINKFNACDTYEDFEKIMINLQKSIFSKKDEVNFFLFNFVFNDKDKAFEIIMKYASTVGRCVFLQALCNIYNPQDVVNNYNYGTQITIPRHKKELQEYIFLLENKKITFRDNNYFDEHTHFFCCEKIGYEIVISRNGNKLEKDVTKISRYFESFEQFAGHLANDLSGCDLSKAILDNINFSLYKMDEYTKLPLQYQNDLTYEIQKFYDRKKDLFVVIQNWTNENGQVMKSFKDEFEYFFDFLFFLNKDLSDSDLLFCDGIDNLTDFSGIDFARAKLKSRILDKLGRKYLLYNKDTVSFPLIVKNEEETFYNLNNKRKEENVSFFDEINSIQHNQHKIYYISDLHLLHRLQNANCKSKEDVLYVLQSIIDDFLIDICMANKNMVLIGGDTSSDFEIFYLFIRLLRFSIDAKMPNGRIRGEDISVVFLLGNHELWGFPELSFEEIVHKYEVIIKEQKFFLLQNDILFKSNNGIQKITTDDLLNTPKQLLRERLKTARIIIFGGLGFAGYNENFNANNNIYQLAIDRNTEIAESKKIERMYNIICESLYDRNVIIFTHMPKEDWCNNDIRIPHFIYLSGHTHRNYFYDDGEYRIYADNQIGYKYEMPTLKYFYVDDDYDLFSEYDDGIYEISKEQYIDFYRGKNIKMQFKRDVHRIYMLKKRGYYCFIHHSKKKQLSIFNGGALKRLDINDINYYFKAMDEQIDYIKKPLDQYTAIQERIARVIKDIGGSGNIHGAIIDIDWYNHIYVNPNDLSITAYWALDIVKKVVFPSIPELLKRKCPLLYNNYIKRLEEEKKETIPAILENKKETVIQQGLYLETDIYKASREIKKMQRLNENILCTWYKSAIKGIE